MNLNFPDVSAPKKPDFGNPVLRALAVLEDEIQQVSPGANGIDPRATGLREQLSNTAQIIRNQIFGAMRPEGRR